MKAKRLLALLMAAALEISSFGVGGTVQAAGIPAETQTVLEQSAEEQAEAQTVLEQSTEGQPETQAALEQSVEVQSETQTDPEHEESLGDEIKVSVQTQISETDSSGFTYEVKDTGLAVTGYEGTNTELNIPAQINGLNVMTIGEKAFSNKATITKVTIPETVTSVGYAAFQNCTGLKELVINAKQLKDGPSVEPEWYSKNYTARFIIQALRKS